MISQSIHYTEKITEGLSEIENDKFVLFGVRPDRPEEGYGYLELGQRRQSACYDVVKFIEKPDKKLAECLIKKNYLWNSGIFLFKAKSVINSFETKEKETKALVEKAINESETDLGFLKVKSHYWTQIRPISFDYSILQDSDNLVAIEYEGDWTDLGDWNSVWNLKASDNYPNNAEIEEFNVYRLPKYPSVVYQQNLK